ncbi:MAG TPA: ankyrin repeat domain-containing protein [Verrucomicrobiota bacterium]|nr:hypothetical protein [Verrucomicrobiales bacterium]HRI16505.1 ankyrin repeat domain-containing protein [Verrucomicrobiota bacterium]
MSKSLPARPNLEQLKKQAKELLSAAKLGEPSALKRFTEGRPGLGNGLTLRTAKLGDAQQVIARKYGFASWTKLKEHIESLPIETENPLQQLVGAFHNNDAPRFRELLQGHPEFKAKLNEPIGPFDSPAITNVSSREMLDVLLEAGADINAKSRWWAGGFGLLHNASPELAAYAIQRGANVDAHAAARLGLFERLRELVAADPTLVNAPGGDGQTPLHFASTVQIAEFLLDHGANIDARDVDHESTPAQYMIRDRQEIVRFLVQRGCRTDILMAAALGDAALVRQHLGSDPECVRLRVTDEFFPKANPKSGGTIYQWTLGWHVSPHEVARQFGHSEIVHLLRERSPADVQLLTACWAGDGTEVQSLIAGSPGLASTLSEGNRRQIADAARNNHTTAVRLMLLAGLPVNALGQHRATPLHWAAFHGNVEMAREILRYQPPLELTDSDFHGTPLGWAIHGSEHGWHRRTGDYAGTVEALLQAGAKTPEKRGGSEAVQLVLQRHDNFRDS